MYTAIEKNYGKLCIKGEKNFNDIKPKYQEGTKNYIEEQGYIVKKDGTVEKKVVDVE